MPRRWLHYVEVAAGKAEPTGIKDLDVWSFFSTIPGERFPADRRNACTDFGESEFGGWDEEAKVCHHYKGSRVDLLMRALPVPADAYPVSALRPYLAEAPTASIKFMAKDGPSAHSILLIDGRDFDWPRQPQSGGRRVVPGTVSRSEALPAVDEQLRNAEAYGDWCCSYAQAQ